MTFDTRSPRIRGRRLQAIRRRHFSANPLCVVCHGKGRARLATELDHVVALHNGGTDTDDNRQGLCGECHEEKTRRDLGQKVTPRTGSDGWPE